MARSTCFAALNVATGEVIARCTRRHRAADLVAFLRELDASVAPDLDGHVVLDNLPAHKARRSIGGGFAIRRRISTSRPHTPRG
jgi:hypothetical protein